MERVFAAVVQAGVVLRELTREEERLEDVFASLTAAEVQEIRAGLSVPTDVDGPPGRSPADEEADDDDQEDDSDREDEEEDGS